jgi:hypothetical protein
MTSAEAATLKFGDKVKVTYHIVLIEAKSRNKKSPKEFTPNSIMTVRDVKALPAAGGTIVRMIEFDQWFHHNFVELFERAHK